MIVEICPIAVIIFGLRYLYYLRRDPPKSPFKRGTLNNNLVPPLLRGVRGDRSLNILAEIPKTEVAGVKYLENSIDILANLTLPASPKTNHR